MAPKRQRKQRGEGCSNARPVVQLPTFIANTMGIEFTKEEQWQKFHELSQRELVFTRFYDERATSTLRINDEIVRLATNLGIENFIKMHAPTYARLTLEFLASLEVTEDIGENRMLQVLHFQLFNKDYRVTDIKLRKIFKWPEYVEDEDNDDPEERGNYNLFKSPLAPITDRYGFNVLDWWRQISIERKVDPRKSKAASITHAALRYLHRMLTYTISPRESLGSISSDEMCWLWMADQDRGSVGFLDFAGIFISHVRQASLGSYRSGRISFGGMITILATALDKDNAAKLESMSPIMDQFEGNQSHFLSITALLKNRFLSSTRKKNMWIWKVGNDDWCLLPDEEAMALDYEDPMKWRMPQLEIPDRYMRGNHPRASVTEQEGEPIPPPPPRRQRGEGTSSNPQPPPPPSSFDFTLMQQQLNHLVDTRDSNTLCDNRVYAYHVERGDFEPYVNYPYYPAQHGPVPSWNPPNLCYPYWEGPNIPRNELQGTTPSTYDYRRPGGCDFSYDPANPCPFPNSPHGDFGRFGQSGAPTLVDFSHLYEEERVRRLGTHRRGVEEEVAAAMSMLNEADGSEDSSPYQSFEQ